MLSVRLADEKQVKSEAVELACVDAPHDCKKHPLSIKLRGKAYVISQLSQFFARLVAGGRYEKEMDMGGAGIASR